MKLSRLEESQYIFLVEMKRLDWRKEKWKNDKWSNDI